MHWYLNEYPKSCYPFPPKNGNPACMYFQVVNTSSLSRRPTMSTVAIIGASEKPERYAYKAQQMLIESGHEVFPVSRTGTAVLGIAGYRSIADIDKPIDTVTLYIGPPALPDAMPAILQKKPRRVIFNPGTESPIPMQQLRDAGIEVLEACTLVLLRTGQF
jgi:predicted CoA-binding protein